MRAIACIPLAALAVAVALLQPGCGGSPSSSDYPSVTGDYGTLLPSMRQGFARQTWTAADGTTTTVSCTTVTSIPTQNGARFEGTVHRLEPCSATGTFTGEVDHAGKIQFTLTQARWGTCAASQPVQYTGTVVHENLNASGRLTVLCDDGSTKTIDELIVGDGPEAPHD